jgi:trimeric autotransporter adhesin
MVYLILSIKVSTMPFTMKAKNPPLLKLTKQIQLQLAFSPSKTDYSVNVSNKVASLTIYGTPGAANGVVTGTCAKSLKVGDNIRVTITTPDGASKDYTITVNRAPSTDASLKSISLDKGKLSPAFSRSVTEYTVNVWNELESINITPSTQSTVAQVSGGGVKTLQLGANVFVIVVTVEDGVTTETYKVTVNRSSVSTNTTLSTLTESKGTLNTPCLPGTTEYTVDVGNEVSSLVVGGTAADAFGVVTGTGTKNLNVGSNVFTVTITTPVGSKTYTITINRAALK